MPDASQPLRVLQIAKHFPPDRGGIESVTHAISEMLPDHGIRADVLAVGLHARGDIHERNYTVFRAAPDLILGRNKAVSLDYIRAVRALEPHYDVGLLHVPNPLGTFAALRSWRKPLVMLWHADFSLRGLKSVGDRLDARAVRRAAAVIGPTTTHLRASRLHRLLEPKGVVIPLPFLADQLAPGTWESPDAAKVRGFLRGRRMILSVGRLVAYKGFDVLIEAMQAVDADLACVIVGDGPAAAALDKAIPGSLRDRVLLTGSVSEHTKAELLRMAAIGCMPSVTNQEMYGVSQVEFMAVGIPIVSTRIKNSGVPDVNRNNVTGLLVAPRDAGELAGALNRLAREAGLYARLSTGARNTFAAQHSLTHVAARYAELLRRVAAGPG